MVALHKPPARMMTVAEFPVWDFGDGLVDAWQPIDGEPVAMAPGSDNHGSIQSELGGRLRQHLAMPDSRRRVATETGIVPRGLSDRNYRVSDLGLTRTPSSGGPMPPDPPILVEIPSPSNEAETWANVRTCLTIPLVIEVLVVNSRRVAVELLRRDPDGTWPEPPTRIGSGDEPRLASVDVAVPPELLYRTTNPATPAQIQGDAP